MPDYIVSARKYRPTSFDSVVGQHALTTTLLNAIRTGKLAHAYLFCGPRGVGKTTCARIFAKTINCLNPLPSGEACCQCESCVSFDKQISMNIHELDAASNNSVDDIRELTEQVRIPPQGGRYKVFIIDEVHMLSTAAFNAFLKTLEEPPHYVIFILATTEKHKILPTILSRCQVYDFARMTVPNIADHLAYVAGKEGITAEPAALNLIAQKADGGMRDALSIFDQMASFTGGDITYQSTLDNLNVLDSEYYFRLVEHFLKAEVAPCMLLLNEVLAKGFDGGNFIGGLARHLRNLLVAREDLTQTLLEESADVAQRYREQAQRCHPVFLYRALRLCNDCDVNYRQSRNKRLQVELCLIQCAQIYAPKTELGAPAADKAAGSGLRPTQALEPIFNQPAAQGAVKAEPQKAAAAPATTAPKAQTAPQPAAAPKAQPAAAQVSEARPAMTRNKPQQPSRRLRILNLDDVSINPVGTARGAKNPEPAANMFGSDFYVSDHGTLTDTNLVQCWQQFASQMEQCGNTAMANRLRGIKPQRTGADAFTLTIGSELMERDMQGLRQDIERFIAHHVGVPSVGMTIHRVDAAVAVQAASPAQVLKDMVDSNPAVGNLVRQLGLELD